jgi:hypothetical protein
MSERNTDSDGVKPSGGEALKYDYSDDSLSFGTVDEEVDGDSPPVDQPDIDLVTTHVKKEEPVDKEEKDLKSIQENLLEEAAKCRHSGKFSCTRV